MNLLFVILSKILNIVEVYIFVFLLVKGDDLWCLIFYINGLGLNREI